MSAPTVEFNDVRLKARAHKKEILQAVGAVIEQGIYFHGAYTHKLEKALSDFLRVGNIVTTSSGHDALCLGLLALRLSSEDEIIVPVNAYPTVFAAAQTGAKVVLVDCDENAQINTRDLRRKISSKTKAVVVVHLYGLTTDIDEIQKILRGTNVALIEDCAQAFGTTYKKKYVGTLGEIGCFSFYPTKNLSTLGDGGALWTHDTSLLSLFKKSKNYGENTRYQSQFVAGHSRFAEIQASITLIYLKNIQKELHQRKILREYYKVTFEKHKKLRGKVRVLESHPLSEPATHLLVVKVPSREKLAEFLQKNHIPTLVHYPYPAHLVKAFSYLGYKKGDFPVSEGLSQTILSLPFHPMLKTTDVDYIVKKIEEFYV